MRVIDTAFQARLLKDALTTCLCWRLTRKDGFQLGGTDHDRPLVLNGINCLPSRGFSSGVFSSSLGLQPDQASLEGALASDAITESDIQKGLWDGARFDAYRVDWTDPSLHVHLWAGRLSKITRGKSGFEAELVSFKADLERSIGRVYARKCDAAIGDTRCSVDLTLPAFLGYGTVTQILGDEKVRAVGLSGFNEDWFKAGALIWISGANNGAKALVISHQVNGSDIDITFSGALDSPIQIGDNFDITAGCDKAFETCKAKFANPHNFRGFPHLPGNDAILQGPLGQGRDDGGSRQ